MKIHVHILTNDSNCASVERGSRAQRGAISQQR